jgi:chemotaxis-related protein WspB
MSMLLFYIGSNRYVIENKYISQIIPRIGLRFIPYVPSYIAGLLNMENLLIPVIDLCYLVEQRVAPSVFHTRIILLENPLPLTERHKEISIVGVIAEKVTEIIDLQPAHFKESGFHIPQLSYFDGIYTDSQGVIQCINVEEFFKFTSEELFKVIGMHK